MLAKRSRGDDYEHVTRRDEEHTVRKMLRSRTPRKRRRPKIRRDTKSTELSASKEKNEATVRTYV